MLACIVRSLGVKLVLEAHALVYFRDVVQVGGLQEFYSYTDDGCRRLTVIRMTFAGG